MNVLRSLRTTSILLILLVAASMSALASAQGGVSLPAKNLRQPATPTVAVATGMNPMMGAAEFDLMFIDMMIPHHQSAIAMAEVAIERGEHPELVQLAEDIITAQEAEIAQLQAWRDAWYPDAPQMSIDQIMGGMWGMLEARSGMSGMQYMSEMSTMGMMDPSTAATSLRAAPEPFDLAFINAMIPHHLSALMMTEMASQQAIHPELVALADEMFTMQETEITTMRTWRAEWAVSAATPSS